jgi:hypothetical protein
MRDLQIICYGQQPQTSYDRAGPDTHQSLKFGASNSPFVPYNSTHPLPRRRIIDGLAGLLAAIGREPPDFAEARE